MPQEGRGRRAPSLCGHTRGRGAAHLGVGWQQEEVHLPVLRIEVQQALQDLRFPEHRSSVDRAESTGQGQGDSRNVPGMARSLQPSYERLTAEFAERAKSGETTAMQLFKSATAFAAHAIDLTTSSPEEHATPAAAASTAVAPFRVAKTALKITASMALQILNQLRFGFEILISCSS